MSRNGILAHCAIVAALIVGFGGVVKAAPPNLGGVNPNRGPAIGGTFVTISGVNFTGTTSVTFGGVNAPDFIVLDDFRLRVVTPEHEPGLVTVTATNPDGTGSQVDAFRYLPVATARDDDYATPVNVRLTVAAPGVLANDETNEGGPMTASPWTGASNGALSLASDGGFTYTPNPGFQGVDSFMYRVSNDEGPGTIGTVRITVGAGGGPADRPSSLRVWSKMGNEVTFRWRAPTSGPAPTAYQIQCGNGPGDVTMTLTTSEATPALTVVLPGNFAYCRVHALVGTDRSAASNEILIYVTVPGIPPSPPEDFTGTVNGSSVELAWRNTFDNGLPASLVLDVTGSAVTSIPLAFGETVSFSGAPAGMYTLTLRAINALGSSPPSNPVTLNVPGPCSGAPPPPVEFIAWRVGNIIFATWGRSPATNSAAISYVVNVSGAFAGSVPTTDRIIRGTASAGAYNLSVVAINACGASGPSPVQTVVIP